MKKLLMILLVTVLALNAAVVSALAAEPVQEEPSAESGGDSIEGSEEALTEVLTADSFPETQDIVTIQDGVFTITSNGVTVRVQLPSGWLGFTQNLELQLDDYNEHYDDPRETVDYLIDNGISLLAWSTESSAQIVVSFLRDGRSELFFDFQDQEMFDTALNLYQKHPRQGEEISAAVINGRNYVRSLESAEGYVSLLYFTCINGAFAMFNLYSDAIPMAPEEEETLVSLLETATLE